MPLFSLEHGETRTAWRLRAERTVHTFGVGTRAATAAAIALVVRRAVMHGKR